MNLLNVHEVAYILGIPRSSAYEVMRRLPHYKIGSRIRVHPDDLQRYLMERKINPRKSRAASALYEARRAARHG